jgi:transcriptional regulator of acetoin/glycerol metabolism
MFLDTIVGCRGSLRPILNQVEAVAGTNTTVLITGETGTGKEVIARAIHELSPRRSRKSGECELRGDDHKHKSAEPGDAGPRLEFGRSDKK